MLGPFSLEEAFLLLKKIRSKEEVLKYFMIQGDIPRYLESIDTNKSFEQNMNLLFFRKDAPFFMSMKRFSIVNLKNIRFMKK